MRKVVNSEVKLTKITCLFTFNDFWASHFRDTRTIKVYHWKLRSVQIHSLSSVVSKTAFEQMFSLLSSKLNYVQSSTLLPPLYVVCLKVMFSVMSVCPVVFLWPLAIMLSVVRWSLSDHYPWCYGSIWDTPVHMALLNFVHLGIPPPHTPHHTHTLCMYW